MAPGELNVSLQKEGFHRLPQVRQGSAAGHRHSGGSLAGQGRSRLRRGHSPRAARGGGGALCPGPPMILHLPDPACLRARRARNRSRGAARLVHLRRGRSQFGRGGTRGHPGRDRAPPPARLFIGFPTGWSYCWTGRVPTEPSGARCGSWSGRMANERLHAYASAPWNRPRKDAMPSRRRQIRLCWPLLPSTDVGRPPRRTP